MIGSKQCVAFPTLGGRIGLDPRGGKCMNKRTKAQLETQEKSRPCRAEQRLEELAIKLPPLEPFGTFTKAVQKDNLLHLSGTLAKEGHQAKPNGQLRPEVDVEAVCKATYLAALSVLAAARQHLGSLDNVTRIVGLGVSTPNSGDVREMPKIAHAASELLEDVFGKDKGPSRLVYDVASLPLGAPIELEIILELGPQQNHDAVSHTWKCPALQRGLLGIG